MMQTYVKWVGESKQQNYLQLGYPAYKSDL